MATKEAAEAVEEEIVEATIPEPKIKYPEPGTRIKLVEFNTGSEEDLPVNTRGTVMEVNEDTKEIKVFWDNAKGVSLLAGVDVWRVLPKRKA